MGLLKKKKEKERCFLSLSLSVPCSFGDREEGLGWSNLPVHSYRERA
jgi:hypothetical protein